VNQTSIPDLVPARMVNEYTYCPRLFFLEWVQARWVDNLDTVEGTDAHRRVDKPAGAAPLPDQGEFQIARSLQLSSTRLGLVARVDVVEGGDGRVRPVDTKRGKPPDIPERAWEPERVQLCVQGLLLREAGFACEEGVLYFAAARQRVTVPFSDELVARTLAAVDELRAVASDDTPPPPLLDSPKCPRCSLVGICLPDETNALAARSELPVRRLLPKDPAPRPLYVSEQGTYARKKGGRVEVRKDEETLDSIRLLDVSQLCLFGNVQISTQLLRELFAGRYPCCGSATAVGSRRWPRGCLPSTSICGASRSRSRTRVA
jgi:CRISP-associated protein Cas1